MSQDKSQHPIVEGVLAMLAVAVAVGVIGGLGIALGSKVLGFGGGSSSASTTNGPALGPSMIVPTYTPTATATEATAEDGAIPEPSESVSESPAAGLTLAAAQTSVSAMQQIDLTGSYVGGDGAILQVQRFKDGAWSDFPVTVSVNGEAFSTYVQTSQVGEVKFRVIDTDTETMSNEVTVTIG